MIAQHCSLGDRAQPAKTFSDIRHVVGVAQAL